LASDFGRYGSRFRRLEIKKPYPEVKIIRAVRRSGKWEF
jgi:hypothetical protein